MELGLEVVLVHFEDELVDGERPSVHRVLDRTHALLRLAHALQVEVSSIHAKNSEALDVAAADGKEDGAETLSIPLLINVDLLFPPNCYIRFARKCFLLLLLFLLRFIFLLLRLLRIDYSGHFFNELLRLFDEELGNLDVASHDGDVQAAGSFLVFLVLDLDAFKQFHDGEVPVVDGVVEAVEPLAVFVVHVVAHWALQKDLHDVFTAQKERQSVSNPRTIFIQTGSSWSGVLTFRWRRRA